MATEFTVQVEDRPGSLAHLTETLARSGVNIMGIHATPCPGHGMVQFITNNTDATVEILRMADIEFTTRQVLLLRLVDEPGVLARLARAVAERGININAVYITMLGQVVLDTDDLSGTQKVALEMGMSSAT